MFDSADSQFRDQGVWSLDSRGGCREPQKTSRSIPMPAEDRCTAVIDCAPVARTIREISSLRYEASRSSTPDDDASLEEKKKKKKEIPTGRLISADFELDRRNRPKRPREFPRREEEAAPTKSLGEKCGFFALRERVHERVTIARSGGKEKNDRVIGRFSVGNGGGGKGGSTAETHRRAFPVRPGGGRERVSDRRVAHSVEF